MRKELLKNTNTYTPEKFIKCIFKPIGKHPELREVQNNAAVLEDIIQGHLEEIILTTGEVLLSNDEGLIKGLPINFTVRHINIRGDALIVGKDGFYYASLSDSMIKNWMDLFNTAEKVREKGDYNMTATDDTTRVKQIYATIMEEIHKFKYIGKKKWGNPSGDIKLLDVFEIEEQGKKLWVSGIEWLNNGTQEIKSLGILCIPPVTSTGTLGQVLEINLSLHSSNCFNTRMFEEKGLIEIRNYGKFTIGRKSLKREDFFNYLINHGYAQEIIKDEKGNKFISALRIEQNNINKDYIAEQLVKIAYMVKEFKDYFRERSE